MVAVQRVEQVVVPTPAHLAEDEAHDAHQQAQHGGIEGHGYPLGQGL